MNLQINSLNFSKKNLNTGFTDLINAVFLDDSLVRVS